MPVTEPSDAVSAGMAYRQGDVDFGLAWLGLKKWAISLSVVDREGGSERVPCCGG